MIIVNDICDFGNSLTCNYDEGKTEYELFNLALKNNVHEKVGDTIALANGFIFHKSDGGSFYNGYMDAVKTLERACNQYTYGLQYGLTYTCGTVDGKPGISYDEAYLLATTDELENSNYDGHVYAYKFKGVQWVYMTRDGLRKAFEEAHNPVVGIPYVPPVVKESLSKQESAEIKESLDTLTQNVFKDKPKDIIGCLTGANCIHFATSNKTVPKSLYPRRRFLPSEPANYEPGIMMERLIDIPQEVKESPDGSATNKADKDFITKDSGKRESFGGSGGAVRDTNEGKPRYDLISVPALTRIAELMARGAVKYGDRNWEIGIGTDTGMPESRFHESAFRHLMQYASGDTSEDHLSAVCFNVMGIMHSQSMKTGQTDQIG